MERHSIRSGRLSAAAYDAGERILEIEFQGGELRRFRHVPLEVWRRFLAAPNPATFYEDRIEEEYPVDRGRARSGSDARSALDSLFGAGSGKSSPGQ